MATRSAKAPPKAPELSLEHPDDENPEGLIGDEPLPLAPVADLEAEAKRIFADDLTKRPVITKLARIMGGLPTLEAIGRNQHFGYNFIKDTQVSGALRPRMAAAGLMVIPEVLEESWVETKTNKGGISFVTKMKVRFTIIDGDSGDEITGIGYGYGDDAGDKGANKAFTAAMKYWLMKLFQIGGEDNEADGKADQRASMRESGQTGPSEVMVRDQAIPGIQRGGQSVKITKTQKAQIFALYKDLELTPEGFVTRVDAYLNDALVISDDEATQQREINSYLNAMTADDAGALISSFVDEKDGKATTPEPTPSTEPAPQPVPAEEPEGSDDTPYGG